MSSQLQRSDNFFIVEFKPAGEDHGYSLGITRKISNEGLSFDSQNYDLGQGEILECILKHPKSDLSVSVQGIIEWKKVAWYHCITGLKFSDLNEEDKKKITELISADKNIPGPSHPGQTLDDALSLKETMGPDEKERPSPKVYWEDNEAPFEHKILSPPDGYVTAGSEPVSHSSGKETVQKSGQPERLHNQTMTTANDMTAISRKQKHTRTFALTASVSAIMLAIILIFILVPSKKDLNIITPPASAPDNVYSLSNPVRNENDHGTVSAPGSVQGPATPSGANVAKDKEINQPPAPITAKSIEADRPLASDSSNKQAADVSMPATPASLQTPKTDHQHTIVENTVEASAATPVVTNSDPGKTETVQPEKDIVKTQPAPAITIPQDVPAKQTLARNQSVDNQIAASAKKHIRVFEESFNNNNADNWEIFDTSAAAAHIKQGAYHIRNKRPAGAHIVLHQYGFPLNSDLTHEASLRLVQSSGRYSYGIVIGAEDGRNNITFQVDSAGRYRVRQYQDGVARELGGGFAKSFVNVRNAINTLKVVRETNNISFYINGIHVDDAAGISFRGSKAGFIVEGDSEIAVEKTRSQSVES
ncbi:MAG: hypothetical protein C4538_06830 [Nitrospiraceae bacterium]|nr:MAG: hypothetical protein C4538_06830 [Nitrospiraceae bacterium]